MKSSILTSVTTSTYKYTTCIVNLIVNCAILWPIIDCHSRSHKLPFTMVIIFILSLHVTHCLSVTSTIAFHQENELADGRVHYAGRFLGDQAQLPCVVNFDECGQIYFLTWSKNVSNEWQRVYLYSETYQTALGDLATGDGTRVTLDASNMSSLGLAFLKIQSITIEDEATYKCDVTYVHGTCPSLTYTRLFALVSPGEPFLRVNGRRIEEPRVPPVSQNSNLLGEVNKSVNSLTSQVIHVGPYEEGSTITLECSTSGGRPLPEVKWYNGSNLLRSRISINSNPDVGSIVTSTTRFILTRFELNSIFTCDVMNNATENPLSKTLTFDVHVKPLSLRIRGPESAVVSGEMVSMTCLVEGARPAATIDWFNRSELVDPQPITTEQLMPDSTFRTSSTLVFVASRFDQERDFSCVGTNSLLKEKNEVPLLDVTTLKVLYAPECKVRLLPKESNGHTKLQCESIASPAVSRYVWKKNNETITRLDDDSLGSILIIYDGSIESYTCVASNMMGVATCKLQAHQIEVSAVTGSQAALPCEVDIAKCGPVSQIIWSKNFSSAWKTIVSQTYHSHDYKTSRSSRFNSSTSNVDDGRFTLDTRSNNSHALLRVHSLSVHDEGLYKCDITYVQPTCPSITYVKLHSMVVPSKPVIFVNGAELESMRVSPFKSLSSDDTRVNVDDIVTIGPFDENSVVVLECNTVNGRPLPQVAWYNGTNLMSSKTVITSDSVNSDRMTAAVSFILTRSDLTSHFSCHVWNNATLRPIVQSIAFDVHVKPVSLHVRGPISGVVEGELVSISCIVEDARPPASILWFNRSNPLDPQPLSNSDLLATGAFRTSSTFTFTASRYDHRKDFSCIASNQMLKKAGEAAFVQSTTLKVLFAPDCTIKYLASGGEDGTGALECLVNASPDNVTYTWSKNNRTLEVTSAIINSTHIDGQLDSFTCVASNSQGSSKSCTLQANHVNDPSGWAQLLLGDENVIIVAVSTGIILCIIILSTIVTLILRRKLKSLNSDHHRSRSFDQCISHHYTRDVVNQPYSGSKDNKIAILDEQASKRNSQYLTILASGHTSVGGVNCSPLKSPIIRNTYQTISLRPDGSPLLSDYVTDGSDSPTSAASSIQQHLYERPVNLSNVVIESTGQPLHNMNIPIGYTSTHQLPPLLPDRGYLRLPNHTLHHYRHGTSSSSSASSTRTLLPHHQLLNHTMINQHNYRSLTRQRASRTTRDYSDFRA